MKLNIINAYHSPILQKRYLNSKVGMVITHFSCFTCVDNGNITHIFHFLFFFCISGKQNT